MELMILKPTDLLMNTSNVEVSFAFVYLVLINSDFYNLNVGRVSVDDKTDG